MLTRSLPIALILAFAAMQTSALADDGGPYTVTIIEINHWQDQKNTLPGSIDHANANRGGDPIPWETQTGITTNVAWAVNISIGSDALGLKVGGAMSGSTTVNLSTQQSGSVEAPPAGGDGVNHDVEFFGYKGLKITKAEQVYRVQGGFVLGAIGAGPVLITKRASRWWTVEEELITYKNSQEDYGADNYPRPDPYCLDKKEYYWTPADFLYLDESNLQKVGTVHYTDPNVSRNWD